MRSYLDLLQESSRELSIHFTDLIGSLSTLRELVSIDIESGDERVLVRDALKVLIQNYDMERCSVFLLEPDGWLVNVSGMTQDESGRPSDEAAFHQVAGARRFRIGEGVIGEAARSLTLQHCPDCRNDPRFAPADGEDAGNMPGALISMPIHQSGELLGVLNISHPRAGYFNEWHERLLNLYASLLALLIVNHRLLRHLEGEVRSRTRALEQTLDEARKLKQRYEELSLLDELTTLFNRRYFFPNAEAALVNALRYGEPFSILLLDLDHFKAVNDQYGHAAGDCVLKAVSTMLRQLVRRGDMLARMGGEEFIVAASNADAECAQLLAERILQGARELALSYEDRPISIRVSIGIGCLNHEKAREEGWTLDTLVSQADSALYDAKRQGRDRSVFFIS
jgi:diguanylate cyclase (GGDEF)-like protein